MSSSIGALVQDQAQAPGYCSSATVRPLTAAQMTRIIDAAAGRVAGGITVFSEKDLVGKGTRKLVMLEGDVSSKFTFVEYAGVRKAKFVSKDAERLEAMIDGALGMLGESFEDIEATKVLLLKEDGTMCRRNTLPRLHRNGIIVMRCEAEDSSSSEESE